MRERTKVMRGFDSDPTANKTMQGFRLYYNFLRPHQGLNGSTPAEAANVDLGLGRNRWKSMIAQSVKNGGNPPKDEEAEKYRKQTAIGVVQTYLKRKEGLPWVRNMISFLRNESGLTEQELEQILRYLNAEHLRELL